MQSDVPLAQALIALREAASAAPFALEVPGAAQARDARAELVHQLDDYVLPRLGRLDAPLLTVVGGSTGAGKSTVVNSLVRAAVTPSGVLRPTTRSPVLVCHPDDLAWFADTRVLPDLTRTTGAGTDHETLQLVPSSALEPGLAFLDAPDIDSVVAANRRLAGQLLAAADLWLFVTTAARYADAVPWDVLETAASRGTALAVLLDRVPPGAEHDIAAHLREMLAQHGLGDAPLFVVPETVLEEGLLPDAVIGPIRGWFDDLAKDAAQRDAVVRRTLDGALDSLRPRTTALAAQARAQVDAATRLRTDVRAAYESALAEVDTGMRDGVLLRGEVLARWQEFVGTGELLRTLQDRVGRWRDRFTAALMGRPRPGSDLTVALESGVALLVDSAAEQAAERAATTWRSSAAGAALLRSAEERLDRVSPGFRADAERTVRDWQAAVLDLVRREGGERRTTARVAAYSVNATGLLVMILVFATTSVMAPPIEVAVAGGTTVLSQKVLEAMFGDQAVRALADQARADLLDRAAALLGREEARFVGLLERYATRPDDATALDRAAAAVERAR
ncbi:dynamin family protein [Pseudonocardia humida]|uniref:ABC transporter n=1 Tax=Pseudonocardia humida TaxID=2800819 RepID=A0ABT1A6N7_9PSEU|nr:dynamin family protein [Pseudonocardia humida]MCO1658578.1 ABC transporter [Pseudonocardia humida]